MRVVVLNKQSLKSKEALMLNQFIEKLKYENECSNLFTKDHSLKIKFD